MTMDVRNIVVGAGVVGLAIARRLAPLGETLILDRADRIGAETSSRNSEVIHAGIYYPAGSLKARLCVAGRDALYAYAADRGIAARRLGKLIVATEPDQIPAMRALMAKGAANGVTDLRALTAAEAQALEPEVRCHAALLSPSSGIIDSHALMLALLADAEAFGAVLSLHTTVTRAEVIPGGFRVWTADAAGLETPLSCETLVNAAGHGAPGLARRIAGHDPARVPQAGMAKGNYLTVSGRAPFRHLIYPMPARHGLGVHVTLDLQDRLRLGPDVEWTDRLDYTVAPGREDAFRSAVARYWPGIADRDLAPGYAGIRPKLGGPDDPAADFLIDGPAEHGVPGLVQLMGIESPGLSASLAIADEVAARLG